jgi:hypothetical protein
VALNTINKIKSFFMLYIFTFLHFSWFCNNIQSLVQLQHLLPLKILTVERRKNGLFMKRKFKQWWSSIPPISTKQKKV